MELIYTGGAKGTGKSMLIAEIRKKHARYSSLHTGDIYWQNYKTKSLEEITDIITENVLCQEGRVILDTHYVAYFTGKGWLPCWSKKSLQEVAESPLVTDVQLYLIEASVEDILARREKDQLLKKRRIDRESVIAEIELSRTYFKEMKEAFGQKVRRAATIYNTFFEEAARTLEQCLHSF